MLGLYDYEPAVHKFVSLPVTDFLRRETRMDCLVTYHHAVFGNWVVSLFDKTHNKLLDVALLGCGNQPDVSPVRVQFAIKRIRVLKDKAEAQREVRSEARHQRRLMNEQAVRQEDVAIKTYKMIKKKHGEHQADKYTRRRNPELVGGGKPKWHSAELGS